jgi:16S rRNA A1518/A1519 N6-dimethyltransferase RsmA/KsgA/DIM1 with predicted DNA glycosylase/AP lyase activity
MHLSIVGYTVVGLILNEPKVARVIKKLFKNKLTNKSAKIRESINSERTRLTAANGDETERVENLKVHDEFQIMNIGLEEDKHISATNYEQ